MATLKKRGDRWTAEIRKKDPKTGKRIRHSVTRDTKTAAAKAAKAIEVAIEDGRWTDHGDRESVTLGDVLREELAISTNVQNINRLKKWLRDPLAERRLDSIQPSDIASWRNARMAEGRASSTIRNDINVISKIFTLKKAEGEGWHDLNNPVTKGTRKKLKMPKGRNRRLREGEYDRIITACRECAKPEIEHLFVLAIETAMRAGELQAIHHDWIEDSGEFIYLPDWICKNDTGRLVPLTDAAMAAIAAVKPRRGNPRVFPWWFGTDRLSYWWGKVRKAAGCPDLRWHDLRHEAASRLFERGLGMHEVREITGHKTLEMLMRYVHPDVRELRDKINGKEGALRAPSKASDS